MRKNRKPNIILLTDSYKLSHWKMYPKGCTRVYSYLESRGGEFEDTVFFGLQYYLQQYLEGVVLEQWMIEEAYQIAAVHFNNPNVFNRAGWQLMLDTYGGKLPISIRAVAEGTVVPTKNVLMTIEATDDDYYFLTNQLESLLLKVWYPTTVATLSRECKKILMEALIESGDPMGLLFKLHDFGYRGVSSEESAKIGGAAHLVNFKGSDTLQGIIMAMDHYNEPMAGYSVPAGEHSTFTAWGRDGEADSYENALREYPDGILACVSDSYDIYYACTKIWGEKLKALVLSRDGVLVIRPDSGDAPVVMVKLLDILWEKFGGEINAKGFKVLDPHVRLIWGDGINRHSLKIILRAVMDAGYSVDNCAFGMGGALLQIVNRDTQKFATKCSDVVVNGEHRDVFKDPIDDHGKASKRGRLELIMDLGGDISTVPQSDVLNGCDDIMLLHEVFRNGEVLIRHDMKDICDRASL